MIKRAGAGILSGVILAAALSCSLSGCNTVQNQTEHQTEQKTEQEVSQAAQGENQVSGIEFRLQYPQAMWQGLNLTYADYGNEEEFERKFHNAVQKNYRADRKCGLVYKNTIRRRFISVFLIKNRRI